MNLDLITIARVERYFVCYKGIPILDSDHPIAKAYAESNKGAKFYHYHLEGALQSARLFKLVEKDCVDDVEILIIPSYVLKNDWGNTISALQCAYWDTSEEDMAGCPMSIILNPYPERLKTNPFFDTIKEALKALNDLQKHMLAVTNAAGKGRNKYKPINQAAYWKCKKTNPLLEKSLAEIKETLAKDRSDLNVVMEYQDFQIRVRSASNLNAGKSLKKKPKIIKGKLSSVDMLKLQSKKSLKSDVVKSVETRKPSASTIKRKGVKRS